MNLKEIYRNILRFLANYLLEWALSLLCRSLRFKVKNGEHIGKLIKENKKFVLAFWHGSMIVPWYVHRNKRFSALVSKSKDGGLLYKILCKWNYNVIRGSSHRGGSTALTTLINCATKESPVLITPDGPRGPAQIMKPGAVITAKKANVPLILLGIYHHKKKVLKSWDKFEVPFYFSTVNLLYSDPICIDSELPYEETSRKIEECQNMLNQLQIDAEKL